MKIQQVIQTVLQVKHSDGSMTETVTFLPVDKRVHVGSVITLEGDPGKNKWTVARQGQKLNIDHINRKWSVGGLF